ncbi:MAG: putative rane-bound dehydrogenase [Verrucomicrobiales bacterium]|nr:putative rane-bound dehydrogenase [Verrucomicrobiales bacterium]
MRKTALLISILVAADGSSVYAAGRQLTGQHAPATTPALSPADAQKKFKVPDGFEVRLFASEPDVINPVAMTWDARGRLWVVELYEYPLGAPAGAKPRDRIKILEDTDGDGKADKVTIFADGLNLATGIALGNGGVYVAQAPLLLFLEDTDGDGKADKRTVLKSGFGLHDRHELLNDLTWGPDGWLYMTEGVFTHSEVKNPDDPNDSGVRMDAALARYHPRTKKFEVFSDGTSNPWGVDFDKLGNAFVSACVIDHLFHLAPGGIYVRQGGTPMNPYSYQLIPSIVDHKHFMAAYAGIQIYQGNQFPPEYLGRVFMGNIHQSAINQDRLTPNGSSFKASAEKDFLEANDGWFRPVSEQTGPDGALWVMDWYDKYPCYQNANADPEGVDRELGRIWRVVYTGAKPGSPVMSRPEANMDLNGLSSKELVKLLAHPNIWQRRMAQRLLSERQSAEVATDLQAVIKSSAAVETRLAALWSLHGSGNLDETTLDSCAQDKEAGIRMWAARLTGEQQIANESTGSRLEALAGDSDPSVRLAVATAARQFVSGSLTTDTAPRNTADLGKVLVKLIHASKDGQDPLLPFMIWMAAEPAFARNQSPSYEWLLEDGLDAMPLSGMLVKKAMRRICDMQSPEKIDEAMTFLSTAAEKSPEMASSAMDGLIEGQKGKAILPSRSTEEFFNALFKNSDKNVQDRAQKLGTLWGNKIAMTKTLVLINNSQTPLDERMRAVQAARQLKNDAARDAMLQAATTGNVPESLRIEAIRALGELGGTSSVAERLLDQWTTYNPQIRRAAGDILVSRSDWSKSFLDAVEEKRVEPRDISVTALRTLSQSNNPHKIRAAQLIGKFRESDSDKIKLIAQKKKIVLAGSYDIAAGHEIAKKTCFVCHKMHGEGAEVGPDLTGVGRSTLDALLANVIDPNQVVGKGYENVEVETKDGRSVSGRLVENTDTRIKLLSAGPKEDVISKSDIATQKVSELSVMPEGLEQMTDQDFRNLIWYILNPPQDNRPMTPQLRKELIGD